MTATRIARLDRRIARIVRATWSTADQTLSLEAKDSEGNALPTLYYRRSGTRWRPVGGASATSAARRKRDVRLTLEQSLNDRPVLVAVNDTSGQRRPVLDPNPWISERALGRVQAISWRSKDGRTWHGGLYYPPHHREGRRYPTVIQTHGFDGQRFSLNGYARNFPGQALSAHNILVLQVRENYRDVVDTPQEWQVVQAGYEAAIDYLDGLGIVDRDRVGIQGWSRSGSQMAYTLTHSPYPFAAGVFTNTADIGWLWYLVMGAPGQVDTYYGAAPFGNGLQAWLHHAPSFNLDRVRTPMLMWEERTAVGLWDWYAGLRRLRKPVEYWVSPDAAHDVFQVGHRIHSNQLVVDWFRFWLKGEEDASPEKGEQYVRWRTLRVQQESSAGGS